MRAASATRGGSPHDFSHPARARRTGVSHARACNVPSAALVCETAPLALPAQARAQRAQTRKNRWAAPIERRTFSLGVHVVKGPQVGARSIQLLPRPLAVRHVVLAAVFASALALRLWGISGVLPYVHHPDEITNEYVAVNVAHAPLRSPA